MKHEHLIGAVALLWLYGSVLSVAAEDKRTERDARFVLAASEVGLAEVNFGMLAEKRTANEDVRTFAHELVVDHVKANKELGEVAARRYGGASAMNRGHLERFDKLSTLEGDAFDRAFLDGQIKEHESSIRLFEEEARKGQDEQLQAWAGKMLPTLRDHLKKARNLSDKLKSGR